MHERLESVLTKAFSQVSQQPTLQDIDVLARYLAEFYDSAKADGTLQELKYACQSHPIAKIFLEDPYTRRAFEKPRGYAGDAVMLDYIYRPGRLEISSIGAAIHEATVGLPNAKSILWRRDYLAQKISDLADKVDNCRILSLASGHMRELESVRSNVNRRFKIWALDQDPSSIDECLRCYPEFDIQPINKSISYLFKSRPSHALGFFDLIYSAGLCDYLSDKTFELLISKLYQHLKPGASLIVGNFTPDSHGRGFMECFMNWTLIYRDEADLIRIAEGVIPGAPYNVFRDEPGNVAYIELHKPS